MESTNVIQVNAFIVAMFVMETMIVENGKMKKTVQMVCDIL